MGKANFDPCFTLELTSVYSHVILEISSSCEGLHAGDHLAVERPLPSVDPLVDIQPLQHIEALATPFKGTLVRSLS